jgi:hypothetical protein
MKVKENYLKLKSLQVIFVMFLILLIIFSSIVVMIVICTKCGMHVLLGKDLEQYTKNQI